MALAVAPSCSRDETVSDAVEWGEFVPLLWSPEMDDLVKKPGMLTSDFVGALAEVLAGYGEPFRYDPGPPERFYVTAELAANEELVYNFTKKSQALVKSRANKDGHTAVR